MTSAAATVMSVPGKTFLVGEYLALDGGPSILLTTEPRFVLRTARQRRFSVQRPHTFAGASPAGRLFVGHEADFQGFNFRFDDPHRGAGGLGASSAQFALMYSWLTKTKSVVPETYDWSRLLTEYRACAWSGEGQAPSGADLVAQLIGGVSLFDGRSSQLPSVCLHTRLQWSFPELSFTLIRTGVKVATHEHLKRAQVAPYDELRTIMNVALEAFRENSEAKLIEAVNTYGEKLGRAGLTAEGTLGLVSALQAQAKGVRAVKGCGAMGADVIVVLHDRIDGPGIKAWAVSKGLEICGEQSHLAKTGLKVE